MGLHKRENSSNWYYSFQENNKKYVGSTGTANKTKALQVEREMRNRIHSENFLGEAEEISLREAVLKYLEPRKQYSYYRGMESISRKMFGSKRDPKSKKENPCYGLSSNLLLHEIQTKHVERLVAKRKSEGDKPATIKHEIGLISSTLREMQKLGYKAARDVVFPQLKTTYRLRYLDPNDEVALLRELDPQSVRSGIQAVDERTPEMQRNVQDNYDLVIMLLDTGCRYSEAANIPWSSVDLEAGTLNIYRSKVSNEDVLYMTNRLKEVMARRFAERQSSARHVFENKAGKARGYAAQAIKKAMDRAGLNDENVVREKGGKVTMHTLRHSYASKLVKNGISLFEVSVLLGHSDSKMTQRYAHLAPNDASRKAVSLIDSLQNSGAQK
ncbi:tyrosine-type recombinase/integrase [Pseudoduganella namucuonensis]|uniref:Site-specific recombinase XerD n=1 Tax=Pseudoduganella namucuonensis TaxID=1035707 RepID=A0A1I7M3L5_9BURK|nr:site-specific integrase [Pseudoduganella namucuonensis]SFV16546.1 Site-specific recombinase XerD [Pseudoduganella namucuonensis]